MRTTGRCLLCCLLLSLSAMSAHSQTTYTMRVLGMYADGALATDINDKGQIVGYHRGPWGQSAWMLDGDRWDTSMGGFAAQAINNNSVVAGSDYANNPYYAMYAQTYYGGQWHLLNTVSGIATSSDSEDINDLGSVVGYCSVGTQTSTGSWTSATSAFLCKGGVTSTLAYLGGISYAEGINIHDQVVGYWNKNAGWSDNKAFLWDGNTVTWLPMLDGATSSLAWAINDSGAIVGQCGGRPVIWENGGVRALATSSTMSGNAFDINNRGQIVGYVGGTGYIWDGDTTYDLGNGNVPYAINDHGVAVGGSSVVPNLPGTMPAIWTQVPEPESIICLLSGLSAVALVCRRRRIL